MECDRCDDGRNAGSRFESTFEGMIVAVVSLKWESNGNACRVCPDCFQLIIAEPDDDFWKVLRPRALEGEE